MKRAQLAQLYERYGYAVLRRCERLLGRRSDAQDALQEVFLRLHRYDAPLREGEDPLFWLYRIADRCCFDVLATRRRRGVHVSDDDARLSERLLARESPADRTAVMAQLLALLEGPAQEAACLYFIDELTQDEVALALDVSRSTVKRWLLQFKESARAVLELEVDAGESQ